MKHIIFLSLITLFSILTYRQSTPISKNFIVLEKDKRHLELTYTENGITKYHKASYKEFNDAEINKKLTIYHKKYHFLYIYV